MIKEKKINDYYISVGSHETNNYGCLFGSNMTLCNITESLINVDIDPLFVEMPGSCERRARREQNDRRGEEGRGCGYACKSGLRERLASLSQ